jgi:hypothetical protein
MGYIGGGKSVYGFEQWSTNFWLWFIGINVLFLVWTGLFYKLEAKFVNYIRVKLFSPHYIKKY